MDKIGKARGQYKRWMNSENDEFNIPRTTKWRRQKVRVNSDTDNIITEASNGASFLSKSNTYTEPFDSLPIGNESSEDDDRRNAGSTYDVEDNAIPLPHSESEQLIEQTHLPTGQVDTSDISLYASDFDLEDEFTGNARNSAMNDEGLSSREVWKLNSCVSCMPFGI